MIWIRSKKSLALSRRRSRVQGPQASGRRCCLLTGAGQIILHRLSSANGIDISEAISLYAGRLPPWRTLGSALLSVLLVGMGASLGPEGAPKQRWLGLFGQIFRFDEWICHYVGNRMTACVESSFLSDGLRVA